MDVATRKVTFLEAPPDTTLAGMDGLYAAPGGLVAIQNGIRPQRVVLLALQSGEVQKLTVLEANNPHFEEPTLGAVVGGDFYYVANSQWDRFKPDGTLPPAAELAEPVILKLTLPR